MSIHWFNLYPKVPLDCIRYEVQKLLSMRSRHTLSWDFGNLAKNEPEVGISPLLLLVRLNIVSHRSSWNQQCIILSRLMNNEECLDLNK